MFILYMYLVLGIGSKHVLHVHYTDNKYLWSQELELFFLIVILYNFQISELGQKI